MKHVLYHFTRVLTSVFVMLIGAFLVVGAQAMDLLPFHANGKDTFAWLVEDPRVALWLEPGLFYLAAIALMAFLAAVHGNLARHLEGELDTPKS